MKNARFRPAQLALFPAEKAPTDNVFFALFPETCAVRRIAAMARQQQVQHGLKGAPHAQERFHVSLLGLGKYAGLPPGLVGKAIAAAGTITAAPFGVTFDRVMSFVGRQRPLVLCGGEGLAGLIAFQRTLGIAMQGAGLCRMKPQYVPHLTLLYDEQGVGEGAVEPIRWTVREFVLIHSLLGRGRYIPLGTWPLRG